MKLPRGFAKTVLYLDFDGVLHHEDVHYRPRRGPCMLPKEHTLFEHAGLLEEVLRPYPEVLIVLSTSWVSRFGCSGTAKRLPPQLRERVIGATFHSSMDERTFSEMARGWQVWKDVQRRKPRDWFALDEDHLNWPTVCLDKYVRTDGVLGIGAPGAVETIQAHLKRLITPDSKLPPALNATADS